MSLAISRERFSHENSTNTTFCYVSSFSFSFLDRLYIFLSCTTDKHNREKKRPRVPQKR